jgi:hypothetical protein
MKCLNDGAWEVLVLCSLHTTTKWKWEVRSRSKITNKCQLQVTVAVFQLPSILSAFRLASGPLALAPSPLPTLSLPRAPRGRN